MGKISDHYKKIRDSIKDDVKIVVATKTRIADEIIEVIEAGAEPVASVQDDRSHKCRGLVAVIAQDAGKSRHIRR